MSVFTHPEYDDVRIFSRSETESIFPKCPVKVFDILRNVPMHDKDKPIVRGNHAVLIPGSHVGLRYRGNILKRDKMWFQTDVHNGYLKYGYAGFQNGIANAVRDFNSLPYLKEILDTLNANIDAFLRKNGMPPSDAKFNHAIGTIYNDNTYNIGLHSDKDKDFEEGSYFVVLKLGAAREFHITESHDVKKTVFRQKLDCGSVVVVGAEGNRKLKHGVPVMKEPCGPSGSIVFRCIKTRIPWCEMDQRIAQSTKDKIKRQEKKRKRDE